MDRIVDLALDISKRAIVKKEFVPFGIALRDDGKTRIYFFAPSGLSRPTDSNAMIAFGKLALRAIAKRGGLRAVALVYDGRIRRTDGSLLHSDAVLVLIDHRTAPGAVWYGIPYRITRGSGGKAGVRYLDDISVALEGRFAFPSRTSRPAAMQA